MKTMALAVLCGATLAGRVPDAETRSPISARVRASLAADDGLLYERTPIPLRARFNNVTEEAMRLLPVLRPMNDDYVRVLYRRLPGDFVSLRYTAEWRSDVPQCTPDVTLLDLAPGGTGTFRFSLAVDPSRRAFIFDQSGDYEIKIVYNVSRDVASWSDVLGTPPVRLRIEPAPPSEADALADWDVDLATFAQDDGGDGGPHYRREAPRALKFMDKHPMSLYTLLLRQRTYDSIQRMRREGVPLSEYEKEAFERLGLTLREAAQRKAREQ